MTTSKVLEKHSSARTPTVFDPANVEHRAAYRKFLSTGKWITGCQFRLDWPYLTIPAQCESRMLHFYLAHDPELPK